MITIPFRDPNSMQPDYQELSGSPPLFFPVVSVAKTLLFD
jgi:hypothetical protein